MPSISTARLNGSTLTPTAVARVASLVAQYLNHQVGAAVHHLGLVHEGVGAVDEGTEPHAAQHAIEIAVDRVS